MEKWFCKSREVPTYAVTFQYELGKTVQTECIPIKTNEFKNAWRDEDFYFILEKELNERYNSAFWKDKKILKVLAISKL